MRKPFVLAPIVILAAFAYACADTDTVPTAPGGALDAPAAETLPFLAESVPTSALECTYKCTKCLPPTKPECDYNCFYVGKCESRCTSFDICSYGFVWSETACRCLPDVAPF